MLWLRNVLYIPVQLAVMLLLAPLVNGIIKKIKAVSQKRKGPPVLQLYYDFYKLLKKGTVVSETSSWIFRAAPYIYFTAILTAALFVPVTTALAPFSVTGDMILAVYLLALARFFMALAGLDTGSTFGGMGSSREMMISALLEPSLLVSLFTVGLIAGSTSLYEIMKFSVLSGTSLLQPVYFLVFLALWIVLIAETARIPVDDPSTHLELTMVHEAMLLEYSGRQLVLMELGTALKQLIFITLLANVFIPTDIFVQGQGLLLTVFLSLGFYFVKVVGIACVTAVIEISTVKLRLFSVPNLAALSFAFAFLGFIQYFVIGR